MSDPSAASRGPSEWPGQSPNHALPLLVFLQIPNIYHAIPSLLTNAHRGFDAPTACPSGKSSLAWRAKRTSSHPRTDRPENIDLALNNLED